MELFSQLKKCKDCGELKPLSDYYKDKITPDKHAYRCKPCNNLKVKKYKARFPEKDKEYNKAMVSRNPEKYNAINEKRNAQQRKWYKENTETARRVSREYYNKNIEKCRKWGRDKYNPERNKNSALKRNYGITLEDFKQMLEAQNSKCKICENPFKNNKDINTDHCHKIGKARGLLCSACNHSLGRMKENVKSLKNMIKYIQESLPLQHKIKL